MSIDTMKRVWDGSAHYGTRLVALLSLADRANDDGVCWPGKADLCHRARCEDRMGHPDYRRMRRVLGQLAASGELYYTQLKGGTNTYIVATGLSADQIVALLRHPRLFAKTEPEARQIAQEMLTRQTSWASQSVRAKADAELEAPETDESDENFNDGVDLPLGVNSPLGVEQPLGAPDTPGRGSTTPSRGSTTPTLGVPQPPLNHHITHIETTANHQETASPSAPPPPEIAARLVLEADEVEVEPKRKSPVTRQPPSKLPTLQQQMVLALSELTGLDIQLGFGSRLGKTAASLIRINAVPEQVAEFGRWWSTKPCWQANKSLHPTPEQVLQLWRDAMAGNVAEAAPTQTPGSKRRAAMRDLLGGQDG